MNTFIMMMPESYDCYDILMPYPLVTNLSKEEIERTISDWYRSATTYNDEDKGCYSTYILGLFLISLVDVRETSNINGKLYYYYKPLEILTVDEWIEKYKKTVLK